MNNIFDSISKPILFVGVGNDLKSDDGAGIRLVRILKEKKINALDCGEFPENYSKEITSHNSGSIIICDAAYINGAPGDYDLFEIEKIESAGIFTHGASLSMFADYIKTQAQANIYLLGIQPQKVEEGSVLSGAVEKSIKEIADLIVKTNNLLYMEI